MTSKPSPEVANERDAASYRKKPVVIQATQWFKNGDHPEDRATEMFDYPDGCQRPSVIREGSVVRYFRHPDVSGESACKHCGVRMHDHGWIDTLEGGHIVCPGDFVITGVKGERYPCKPDIFAATYELASTAAKADAGEWISVSERLPEALGKHGYTMNVLVAVTCGNGVNMVCEDRYDHHSKTWEEFHTEYSYTVTHWMDLPQHPAASPKTNGGMGS